MLCFTQIPSNKLILVIQMYAGRIWKMKSNPPPPLWPLTKGLSEFL